MKINFNLSALVAQRALQRNEKRLSKSTERLSSGYKINHAKDDAAGLAISKKMRLQIRGLDQASNNTDTGISVCETADGALTEIHDMLQRMHELAIQSANGTNMSIDRDAINKEATMLKEEITRIATQTEFNGETLLDGTFDLKGYTDTKGVSVLDYSDDLPIGKYTIQIVQPGDDTTDPVTDAVVNLVAADGAEGSQNFLNNAVVTAEGNRVTISDYRGQSMTVLLDPNKMPAGTDTVELDITGIGAFTVQVGANEGQILDMRIPKVSLETLGIENTDLSTEEGARIAMDKMDAAINVLSEIRSRLGAYQNRLEHTASSLEITIENMTAAVSRITDLDMADEMVDYTTEQILVQAATSMLAQANTQPEQALQLLQ